MRRRRTGQLPGWRSAAWWLAIQAALLAVIVGFGAPFLWSVVTAFDRAPARTWPWPQHPTLDHFRVLFEQYGAGAALRNSLVVAGSTTILATIVAVLAGYGLSRLRLRGKAAVAYGVLLLQSIPLAITMVPIYDLAIRMRLQDAYLGLVISHTAVVLPLLVWLMKGFADAVPPVLEEEAWVDGASHLRAWVDVVVPASLPGIAVVAGFAFVNAWAEVLMVVVLVTRSEFATLPFVFYRTADAGSDAQQTTALGILYIAPALLIFLVLRRLMVSGLAESFREL